jgi:hypothetical protein
MVRSENVGEHRARMQAAHISWSPMIIFTIFGVRSQVLATGSD